MNAFTTSTRTSHTRGTSQFSLYVWRRSRTATAERVISERIFRYPLVHPSRAFGRRVRVSAPFARETRSSAARQRAVSVDACRRRAGGMRAATIVAAVMRRRGCAHRRGGRATTPRGRTTTTTTTMMMSMTRRRRAWVLLVVSLVVAWTWRRGVAVDEGLATRRAWGTYDDDETTAIDEIVDAVLEPWRGVKIERRMVDDAMHKVNEAQDAACFIAQHVDGKLYVVGEQDERPNRGKWNPGRLFRTRRRNALQMLQRAIDGAEKTKDGTASLGNFEAAFCLHDCVVSQRADSPHSLFGTQYTRVPDPIPAFTVVKCVDSMNIPFPTWDYATGFFSQWGDKIAAMRKAALERDWQSRKSQAVFRGAQRTCVLYPKVGERKDGIPFYRVKAGDGDAAKKCGRNALVYRALSSARHDAFDVALTDGVKISSFRHDELKRGENEPKFLNKTEQEGYKYQIIAEGECQWANRLRDGLFMGNALIVQEHQCVEYYGVTLKPWEHYIPVDYWFRNLTDAVTWAENYPTAVQRMVASKLEFAKRILLPERVDEYVSKLVREYTKLLDYEVTVRPNAKRVSVMLLHEDDPPPAPGALRSIVRGLFGTPSPESESASSSNPVFQSDFSEEAVRYGVGNSY
jgi:hypothetical protein